jgi:hypothetical protein
MTPAIRQPIAKNNMTKKATIITVLASPTFSSPSELNGRRMSNKNGFRIANKNAVKKKENAIKKKSCAFMFPHPSLFGSSILLLRMLSSVNNFYKKLLGVMICFIMVV